MNFVQIPEQCDLGSEAYASKFQDSFKKFSIQNSINIRHCCEVEQRQSQTQLNISF